MDIRRQTIAAASNPVFLIMPLFMSIQLGELKIGINHQP